MVNTTLYSTRAFLVLDGEGNRILAKYYGNPQGQQDPLFAGVKEQKQFEKQLFAKTKKANNEILIMDGYVVVYRTNVDVFMYIVGSAEENELVLASVLSCFYDTLMFLLKSHVEKRTIIENLDVVLLALDELIDRGIIIETEPQVIAQRVAKRQQDNPLELNFSEQSITQALQNAREQLARSLLK